MPLDASLKMLVVVLLEMREGVSRPGHPAQPANSDRKEPGGKATQVAVRLASLVD